MEGLQYLAQLAQWKGGGGFALDKIKRVLAALDNPQDQIPSVHVAGTNGKGSVSAAVSSILGRAGKRVGLTVSPHFVRVNERIVVDGRQVSDELISMHALQVREVSRKLELELTHFEAITAVAFLIFHYLALDWMVVEVGLGGRLDATNAMRKPVATSIVTIDFDHQQLLGNTLALIAGEKAGIIKDGVPVVVGEMADEPREVITRIAAEHSAPCLIHGRDYSVVQISTREFKLNSDFGELVFRPALEGVHQGHNMAVAAMIALSCGCSLQHCKEGIEGVRWPGRLERVNVNGRPVILESAHNLAGIRSLTSFLDSQGINGIELTFGVLEAKQWQEMIDILIPYVVSWNTLSTDFPNAVPSSSISEYLSRIGIKSRDFGNDYNRALREIGAGDPALLSVISGSMYLLGSIKSCLNGVELPIWERNDA